MQLLDIGRGARLGMKEDVKAFAWTTDATISECLGGNPLRFLTLEQMWGAVLHAVTTTPAPSEMGRLAQLLKAAGLTAPVQIVPPSGPQPGSLPEAEELASVNETSTAVLKRLRRCRRFVTAASGNDCLRSMRSGTHIVQIWTRSHFKQPSRQEV